jgi:hypothetical protein
MSEDYVTKAELASQLAVFKTELKTELKAELKEEIFEQIEKVETTLLKEFRKYAIRAEARLRVNEVTASGLTERMAFLEERVSYLEEK